MTSSMQSLIDTDVLSAIMRTHPVAVAQAKKYLLIYRQLNFSIITKYEILRGLKIKGSATQVSIFDHLCKKSQILLLTDEIISRLPKSMLIYINVVNSISCLVINSNRLT